MKIKVGGLYRYMSRIVLVVSKHSHGWFNCLELGETSIRKVRGSVLEIVDESR